MAALPLLACPGFALSAAPTVISGPMPRLATVPSGPSANYEPAPVPNPDIAAPRPRTDGAASFEPSLTNRVPPSARPDVGAYSSELERRSRTSTAIGNVLAPSLNLRVPLDWNSPPSPK